VRASKRWRSIVERNFWCERSGFANTEKVA